MTDSQTTPPPTPPQEAAFFTTIRGWGLTRGDARVFGGVASGLAERLGWRLAWTRVGVLAAVLFVSGIGMLAYAAAWALLPDRSGRIVAQDFGRGVPNVGALIMIGIFTVLGLIGLGDGWGPFGGWPWDNAGWAGDSGGMPGGIARVAIVTLMVLIPLAIVAGVIVLIVYLVRRNGSSSRPAWTAEGPRDPRATYAAPPLWAEERRRARAAAAGAAQQAGAQAADSARQAAAQTADAAQRAGAVAAQAARSAADEAARTARTVADDTTAWYTAQQQAAATPPSTAPRYATPPGAPVPPAPAAPRPPRVPGPGAGFHLLNLAWFVISAAGVAIAAWLDRLAVNPFAAWFAVYLAGLGVIVALVALTGRRLGFLAFLSAILLIPAAAVIIEAPKIRDGWMDEWLPTIDVSRGADGGVRIDIGDGTITVRDDGEVVVTEPSPEATPVAERDAIDEFSDDFDTVLLPSSCYETTDVGTDDGMSRGAITRIPVESDATEDVTTAYTKVRVEEGTGLAIDPADGVTATVLWADRGIACDLMEWDSVRLTSSGEPVLTLNVDSQEGWATIVIEEVVR